MMNLMLLKDFFQIFPDEESCIDYFRQIREEVGITCPKCGYTEHKWLDGRKAFQCKTCGYRTPLTKGTVMERSHIPLYDWFFTAHMMTSFKQVLSAKEIQYQLERKDYPSVWLMMMKYRDIMGKREAQYTLSAQVELDVSYFQTSVITDPESEDIEKETKMVQTPVLVIAESKPVDEILREYLTNITENKYVNKASKLLRRSSAQKVKKVVRYIKMFAMPDSKYASIKPYAEKAVSPTAKVVTDGGTNLIRLRELFCHESYRETEGEVHEVVTKVLPWVHIVTGECRSAIEAIHKEVDQRFLQLYLNEYCWKFNRRFFRDSKLPKYDLFYKLIRTAANYTSDIKWRNYNTGY